MVSLVPIVERQRHSSPDAPLVIGCGNPYRRDDGFGWQVIAALRKTDAVFSYMCEQQLAPEMAEDISRSRFVVFVDASVNGNAGALNCVNLTPEERPGPHFSHHVAPQDLLSLARRLYGRAPDARLITVTGSSFELEEGLSPVVESRVPDVVALIRLCLEQAPPAAPPIEAG